MQITNKQIFTGGVSVVVPVFNVERYIDCL